uniref:FKBP prolyl isomerase 16 n=1 Tax=Labrus bergylta TaxID=56723 RepID=A0A3Q3LJ77_9LABR
METDRCRQEHKNPAGKPPEPEVRDVISESADEDSHTKLLCRPAEESKGLCVKDPPETKSPSHPERVRGIAECKKHNLKKTNSWKMVRFQDPSMDDVVLERDSSAESLFPEYDRLLRKKVLESRGHHALQPTWGQEVTVKMQCVLEDRTVVEKDCKLVFVIGEGDVNQVKLLYSPDIPAWAPLLYQLQLLDIREKPDPFTLPVADRIRIGNQKRERGNFHFQREEYSMAARAYCMALDVLTTQSRGIPAEEEEVKDYRVKCLNNLAAAQLKLEQFDDALRTSQDVLTLEPNNVKALFRAGKVRTQSFSQMNTS